MTAIRAVVTRFAREYHADNPGAMTDDIASHVEVAVATVERKLAAVEQVAAAYAELGRMSSQPVQPSSVARVIYRALDDEFTYEVPESEK